jgi:hypothetical protein
MRVGQSILRGSGITLPVAAPNGEEGGRRVMAKSSTAKVTSKRVARQASAALRDGRSSKRTRTIAGSALAQTRAKRRAK